MMKRNENLDLLKGFAIFIVMVGHVITWNQMEDGYIYDAIKVIQMPLFMIVSGYLGGLGKIVFSGREYGQLLLKRSLAYLTPFFFWIILQHPIGAMDWIVAVLKQPDKGLWFLLTLFLLTFMVATAQLLGKNEVGFWLVYGSIAVLVVFATLAGIDFLGMNLLRLYLPFYTVGYMASKYQSMLKNYLGERLRFTAWILCIPVFLGLVIFFDLLDVSSLLYLGRQLIASFVGCYLVIYAVVRWWKKGRIRTFFLWLSTYTLEIYVLHFHFARVLNQGKDYQLFTLEGLLFSLATFVCMSGITAGIIMITKKVRILDFLLYGKRGPKRWYVPCLVFISYAVCISYGWKYAGMLFVSTFLTYVCGIGIDKFREEEKKQKLLIGCSVAIHVILLSFFKYNPYNIVLPLGMSFYTFQAIGYLIDVYRKDTEVEKNFWNLALFMAFFPKLIQGPIERSKNLLEQIRNSEKIQLLDIERIKEGLLLLLWGIFLKVAVADRAAVPVNAVFGQFGQFGGVEIILVVLLYSMQLYCDFAGYTNMARGIAKLCGFDLLENFRRPYMADSFQDFWHRWHISLSTWFKDYLYIPLGGSRVGKWRKHVNVMIVFLVSGIWHGTGWTFLVWGGLHGLYQLIDVKRFSWPRWVKRLVVFLFVDAAWVVFRANSLGDVKGMVQVVLTDFRLRDFKGMYLGKFEWALLLFAILVVIVGEILQERRIVISKTLAKQKWFVQYIALAGIITFIVLFGAYGSGYDISQFMYTKF